MPYFATIDNNVFESVFYNTGINSYSNKYLKHFPPSFIEHIKSLSLNSQYSIDDLLNSSYRYIQAIVTPSYPSVYSLNYNIKSSKDFFNYFNSNISFEIKDDNNKEIYPIAVRYTNGKNIWVIERPPFQTTITYRPTSSGSSSDKYKTYTMWMPWTVMVLNINFNTSYYESYLYLNDGPLNSLDDHLIPCFFPNIYTDGRMCLNQTSIGLQQHLAKTQSFDISTVYNYIINDYMSGGWNLDLGSGNFDSYVSQASSDSSPLIKRLNKIMYYGDTSLKIKALANRYNHPSYKRKLAVAFTYFSSLTSQEIVDLVSESKKFKQDFTLNKVIKRVESNGESNSDFCNLFFGFSRTVTPYVSYDYPIIIPSYLRNILNDSESFYDENTSNQEKFIENLLNFLSSHHKEDKVKILSSTDCYFTSDSSTYIYAASLEDFHFISSDDTSFDYKMEKLNV